MLVPDKLISVIVPIYNVEEYLHQCIRSICTQTYTNLEIILVDDGSKDNSREICDSYAEMDNRIVVIHKKNGGLVSARQAGVEIATGDYITYVDGDDWIEATMYEDMMSHSDDEDIIIEGFYYDRDGKLSDGYNRIPNGKYTGEKIKTDILPKMLYSGVFYYPGIYPIVWNKLFKREIIKDIQLDVNPNISMGEDVAVTYFCIQNAESIRLLSSKHYHYRINPKAMTKKYDPRYFEKIYNLINYMDGKIESYDSTLGKQAIYYYTYLFLHGLFIEFGSKTRKIADEVITKIDKFILLTGYNKIFTHIKKVKISLVRSLIIFCILKKKYRMCRILCVGFKLYARYFKAVV